MTIKDVAAYCGVAVSTVSRVLNNHPDVSAETRAKVLDAIKKLNYVPNNSARDLVMAQGDAIGVVVRGAENPFFTPIISAIERRCEDAGYTMVLHQIQAQADEISAAAQLVSSKRLKGVILMGGRYDYLHDEVSAIKAPFVCCSTSAELGDLGESEYSSVSIDDVAEAYRATKLLIDHGHTKIAMLLDSKNDHSISQLRLRGYRAALDDADIAYDDDLVVQTVEFTMQAAFAQMERLLACRRDFTALFAVADSMAIAAMKAIYNAGLCVPKDISLVAIDGIEMSQYTIPTLTTLSQPQESMGEEAVQILLDVLAGVVPSRHVRLKTTLREGETLALPSH